MAATEKLSQLQHSYNSVAPRSGVITAYGYGVQIRVEHGHLLAEYGIGTERYWFRLPRIGHGLKRLVVIGSDVISLAAVRWLSDQDVSFAMIETNGKVLAVTGPVRPSDAKLRRAQALAFGSEVGLRIARELISRKLFGQEQVVRDILHDAATADEIGRFRAALPNAERLDLVRQLESLGAAAYWSAFRDIPITFPVKDLPRVPEHWRTFGTRKSLLTGSPRLASNAPNAILNYLYSLLEAESRLAAATLGLDPGLGMLHMDTTSRDSLACDLMESVRPQVDRYLLTWLLSRPLRREWFFERSDGNCRLMSSLTSQLSDTAPIWGRAVAPVAEWVVQQLWSTTRKRSNTEFPPTRLTQNRKREAKGRLPQSEIIASPLTQKLCRNCGHPLSKGGERLCITCAKPGLPEHMRSVAEKGRLTAQSPTAQLSRSATQKRNWSEIRGWQPSSNPAWLNEKTYKEMVLPRLANCKTSEIARLLSVSVQYAVWIRRGKRQPHRRHWMALARLSGAHVDEN
ncbi:MAG TPA: CRISPR-associated endonuclease Cas1 [Terriglobales bacterium]|jgi:CRISPR-associated endonuclease Cas1